MNTPEELSGAELVPKVFEGEYVADDDTTPDPAVTSRAAWWAPGRWLDGVVRRVAVWPWWSRARAVAGYRFRKAPVDAGRLVWFLVRGHGRWIGKAWVWATHGDLRADARAARLIGDPEARREAQEAIRADARARWAKLGIGLRRTAITTAAGLVLLIVLALLEKIVDRADMPAWLVTVYQVRDFLAAAVMVAGRWVLVLGPIGWAIAAIWEGRDRTPGARWLVSPDRDDADSWVDERMISRALAHLGIAPLDRFFKDGGQLTYSVAARKDGDGTYAQLRLPLGVTADMVAARRSKLAANLGRASLETWPTKGDEDGMLDLWISDKGVLQGGAGPWPLAHDGQTDVFTGVPFGLSQRGLVINAPLIGVNWLIGGRPGQGKSAALRTLMLGAALDPSAELWMFVMGESPDFDPFTPRLARYRMGMDDTVAQAGTQALADLLDEMERRGKVLGEQPGHPPKVSRKLADRAGLGLHPLICGIDECHELFQHPKFGKQAAELVVRLIKRGRKYGIVLLLATQSPTKDSIPREVTRNISCGVAFSVADQVANDGLLGSGKYAAGIRATELRINSDRGTCVAVGTTDETFELVRTFYVPFEDGADDVSPIVARSLALITEQGRAINPRPAAELESAVAVVDPLTDINTVMDGARRVRTQVILARLAQHNPQHYEGWTFYDLRTTLAAYGISPTKSDGQKVIRAEDLAAALIAREDNDGPDGRDDDRDGTGTQGLLPHPSLPPDPRPEQHEHQSGTQGTHPANNPKHRTHEGPAPGDGASLPDPDPGGTR